MSPPPQSFLTSDCFTAPLFMIMIKQKQRCRERRNTKSSETIVPPQKYLTSDCFDAPPFLQFTMLRRYGAIRPDQTKNRDAEHGEQTVRQTKMFPSPLNFRLLWRPPVPHLQCWDDMGAIKPDPKKKRDAENGEEIIHQKKLSPRKST